MATIKLMNLADNVFGTSCTTDGFAPAQPKRHKDGSMTIAIVRVDEQAKAKPSNKQSRAVARIVFAVLGVGGIAAGEPTPTGIRWSHEGKVIATLDRSVGLGVITLAPEAKVVIKDTKAAIKAAEKERAAKEKEKAKEKAAKEEKQAAAPPAEPAAPKRGPGRPRKNTTEANAQSPGKAGRPPKAQAGTDNLEA